MKINVKNKDGKYRTKESLVRSIDKKMVKGGTVNQNEEELTRQLQNEFNSEVRSYIFTVYYSTTNKIKDSLFIGCIYSRLDIEPVKSVISQELIKYFQEKGIQKYYLNERIFSVKITDESFLSEMNKTDTINKIEIIFEYNLKNKIINEITFDDRDKHFVLIVSKDDKLPKIYYRAFDSIKYINSELFNKKYKIVYISPYQINDKNIEFKRYGSNKLLNLSTNKSTTVVGEPYRNNTENSRPNTVVGEPYRNNTTLTTSKKFDNYRKKINNMISKLSNIDKNIVDKLLNDRTKLIVQKNILIKNKTNKKGLINNETIIQMEELKKIIKAKEKNINSIIIPLIK